MTDSHSKQLDDSDEELPAPVALANAVCEHETLIRQFLDSLAASTFAGKRTAVRDKLREFAQTDFFRFKATMLTVTGTQAFFDDLREQDVDQAMLDRLAEIRDAYDMLDDEFRLVFAECTTDVRNPWLGVSASVNYSEELELPLVAGEVQSLEVPVDEFRVPPSQVLDLADTLVSLTGQVVDNVIDDGNSISRDELEDLSEAIAEIDSSLATVRSILDAVDGDRLSETEGQDSEADLDGSNYYFD